MSAKSVLNTDLFHGCRTSVWEAMESQVANKAVFPDSSTKSTTLIALPDPI